MKIQVIVFTHAGLADGFVDALEMIMGRQEQVQAFGFVPGDDMMARAADIEAAIQARTADCTVVLTDLAGATPTNAALLAISACDRAAVITGVNLLMLIQAAELNGEPVTETELYAAVAKAGGDGIRLITKEMVLKGE